MDEPGTIFLWVFFLLLSFGLLLGVFIRPCFRPTLYTRNSSSASAAPSSYAAGSSRRPDRAHFSPVDEAEPGQAEHAEEDAEVAEEHSHGVGASVQSEANVSSSDAAWARHGDLLHQYRSWVAFVVLQGFLTLLVLCSLIVNRWESVLISTADPTV